MERMLTVVATCRQQDINVLDYLLGLFHSLTSDPGCLLNERT